MRPCDPKTVHISLSMLVVVALFTLSACVERVSSHLSPDYARHKPTSIAVLPMRNGTGEPLNSPSSNAYLKGLLERALFSDQQANLEPPLLFRRQVHDTLHKKNYHVLPLDIVDERAGHPQAQDILQLPATDAKSLLGVDSLLYGIITGWDTRRLKTDNTIRVGLSFKLVDLETQTVLWEGEQPYSSVSIKATQPWHDVRYYISRVVRDVLATLPDS